MPDVTKLAPGDGMAGLALPEPAGGLYKFAAQARSGHAVVLWVVEAAPERVAAELAPCVAGFAAVDALLHGVIQGRPPGAVDVPADTAAPILLDPDRVLARAFGLRDSGVIVLDADLRVAAVFSGGDLGPALAACTRIFERTAPSVLRAQAPVHLVPNIFEPELCGELIRTWEAGRKTGDVVAVSLAAKSRALPDLKKRADVSVSEPVLRDAVRARIERRLVPEIFKVFQYRVTHFEGVRIGCYDAAHGGYFRRHRDNTTPQTARRRFAVSINLNTGEYDGGQVRFPEYSRALYDPETGSALVFSCSLLHEALPVSAGRRFGAFTFAYEEGGAGW